MGHETNSDLLRVPPIPLYSSKIDLIIDKVQKYFGLLNPNRPLRAQIQTYDRLASGGTEEVNGMSILQFTPFQGLDPSCGRMAACNIWFEQNGPKPYFGGQWPASGGQLEKKSR